MIYGWKRIGQEITEGKRGLGALNKQAVHIIIDLVQSPVKQQQYSQT